MDMHHAHFTQSIQGHHNYSAYPVHEYILFINMLVITLKYHDPFVRSNKEKMKISCVYVYTGGRQLGTSMISFTNR